MSALIDPAELANETDLVWLESIDPLDYVRQSLERLPSRRAGPPTTATRDRDEQPQGLYATGAPSEAVDPRTVAPRVEGYRTERSEGGSASQPCWNWG
ncbi:DUF6009 family protein [Kitasatospora sp. NPDC048540]|uniref:DUF6009 family protein n=1 Tax=unclassified Kitasatospora TaxID=2633591 RepID=UPI00053AF383|nr:DUF6009 family protein [Kitasatospora sp. MBT63]